MFLTIESARLPCCTTLSRLPFSMSGQLVDLGAQACRRAGALAAPRCSSSISSADSDEKLLTKFSGFLISCAMPAVSWPSEASFSVWTSRSCAVRRSSSDRASSRGARLHLLEQPHVLDRDHRLVGEGLDQLDLLVGERPHLRARQREDADRLALAQQRHAEDGAEAAEPLRLAKRVFRIGSARRECGRPCLRAARAPVTPSRVRLDRMSL